ncbi:MAG: hypothetical protein U1E60_14660 [Reyranellaceae bacterium]
MMTFDFVAPTTRRGTVRRPVKTGGGWQRLGYGSKGKALRKKSTTQPDTPAERPEFLGMAEPMIRATRTAGGDYAAKLIMPSKTTVVGLFADCGAALAAARVALGAALDAEAGL